MNRRRLTVYPATFVIALLVLWSFWTLSGEGVLDRAGEPVGADFLAFYAASEMALEGNSEAVYEAEAIQAVENRITSGDHDPLEWHYPPSFLLAVLPLSTLPYLLALGLWLTITGLLFLRVVRSISADNLALLLVVAFPGFYRNLTQGQNGFLSAALLGGGLILLDKRPWLAGLVLGLLSYKPHLGVIVFLALLAGGQTRALAGAATSALCVAALALLVFGAETYVQFFDDIPSATNLLYDGQLKLEKMHTLSSALLLAGLPSVVVQPLQAIFSLTTAGFVVWAWRSSARANLRYAATGLGVLAATPFMFDYDLVILALPLLWLSLEGLQRGWLSGERELLLFAWCSPFLAAAIVAASGAMITPLVLAALIWLIVRRIRLERGDVSSGSMRPAEAQRARSAAA